MQATGGAPLTGGHRPVPGVRVVLLVAVGVVLLDQATKWWTVQSLAVGETTPIVDGWFALTHVRNPGAAFSFATGYTIVFTAIAAGVSVVILRLASRLRSLPWALAMGGLLGGALGNLIDRIFREPAVLRGHVVDMIDPTFFPAFPSFNVADTFIVCSAIAMGVLSLLGYEYDGRRVGWAARRAAPEAA
jgi:signal peptidase II